MTLGSKYLPPFPKLVVDIYLDRAYIATRTAERGGKGQVGIGTHVDVWIQYGTDGPRHRRMITVASTPAIYRTGIEAGPATDAF